MFAKCFENAEVHVGLECLLVLAVEDVWTRFEVKRHVIL